MKDIKTSDNYSIWLANYDMPLISNAGYNSFREADQLNWHYHDCYELTFVTHGSAVWEMENDKLVHTFRNQVSLMQPNTKHRGADNITLPCEMYWIVFNPKKDGAIYNTTFTEEEMKRLDDVFMQKGNAVFSITKNVNCILEEIKEIINSANKTFDEMLVRSYLRSLVCQLIASVAQCALDDQEEFSSEDVAYICQYIEANYNREITARELADLIDKKETYVYGIFKEVLGQSPKEYLQRIRISKTIELLKSTGKSITDIALESGFSNSQYFSKVFSRYMGVSPSQYRKSNQKAN